MGKARTVLAPLAAAAASVLALVLIWEIVLRKTAVGHSGDQGSAAYGSPFSLSGDFGTAVLYTGIPRDSIVMQLGEPSRIFPVGASCTLGYDIPGGGTLLFRLTDDRLRSVTVDI